MNLSVLTTIGLTNDQAETYQFLLEAGALTPASLMRLSGETRTNAYMSLAKLEELGLALRDKNAKKLTYLPVSPAKLEQLLDEKQLQLQRQKQELTHALPELLSAYYTSSTRPGIRFYEGPDSLKSVYQDHLDEGKDVYFLRTPADEEFFGEELYKYMEKRAEKGITAHGIGPFSSARLEYSKKHDIRLKRDMAYCEPRQYTAPVEISIYGNKTAFISFGKEAAASIIDSPQIAQAMRELFALAKNSLSTTQSVS